MLIYRPSYGDASAEINNLRHSLQKLAAKNEEQMLMRLPNAYQTVIRTALISRKAPRLGESSRHEIERVPGRAFHKFSEHYAEPPQR